MDKRIVIAVLIGAANAIIVYVNGYYALNVTMDAEGLQLALYKLLQIGGMFILGAGSSYLLLRYKLLLPITLTAISTGYSLYDHIASSMEGFTSLYLGVWFVFVIFVVLAAIIEYGARRVGSMYLLDTLI
ncbi:hypothetical protein [Halomontanus rarus]|uniref:hypothetical protein n=1 Tax=Halomontanus rarus TaxID=3034020 RepID=UPI0023E805FA|nr:hypothetical protein [Halovivax sp. TS33]